MATQLKLRRGTTAQHSTFTGAEGEVTVDTTKETLVVHDGTTVGGLPLARASEVVALTGNQTIAGVKTFSSTISGTISNATNATTAGTTTGNAGTATTLATGRTIGITGDITYTSPAFNGSANVTADATLANSGVTAGTYGDASTVPRLTLDAKGRVTSVSTQAIASGAPTTAQVLSATAGATAGSVGTYAYLANPTGNTTISSNSTYAGSSLRYWGERSGNFCLSAGQYMIAPISYGSAPAGTWRAMGNVTGAAPSYGPSTLFLRIS